MRKFDKHGLFLEDIRMKWFVTYFIVLILPLLISLLVFVQNGKVVDRQAQATGNTALKNVTKQFESWETSCYSSLYKIINDQNIYEYMNSDNMEDNYRKRVVHHSLANYQDIGFSIGEIILYVSNENWIISSSTSCTDEIYYEAMKNEGMYSGSMENWKAVFGGYYKGDFISVPNQSGNQIFYISSNGYSDNGDSFFNVIISLDTSMFREITREFFLNTSANYLIIDQNGEIIYSFRESDESGQAISGNIESPDMQKKKDQFTAFTVQDLFQKWTGAYLVPNQVYYADNRLLRNSMIITVAWCLLLGLAMIWMFVKRNYQPLNNIITNLIQQNNGEDNPQIRGNEYAFIDASIQKVFKMQDRIVNQLDSQNKMMRSNILTQLVKRGALRGLPGGEGLDSYGVHFIGDRFSVAVFFIEDAASLFADASDMSEMEKNEMAKYIIDNVMTELANEGTSGFMVEIDDVQVCIINLTDGEDAEEATEQLLQKIRSGQQTLNQYYDFSFTVSVSDFHQGYEGIRKAYAEAVQAMEYRLLGGVGSVIAYRELTTQEGETEPIYVLEDDQKLLNCIISGEYQKAEETVDLLFETVIKEKSLQAGKLLVYDFSKMLYKAARLVYSPEEQDDVRLMIDHLLECETLQEVHAQSLDIIQEICEDVESRKDTRQNATIKKVMEYVKENYADESLSVAFIADQFGLTPNYLSHVFKESTGEKFLDYIHKIRIENAKEILQSSARYTMEAVARQVGYNNVSTFNRAFLKFEGVYPTKWAEKNQPEQE